MAETHETIADIIAEMRGMGNYQRYSGDHARVLANRLEAAHKREIDEAERRANHAAMKNVSETLAKVGPLYDAESVGDCAKLREAMSSIKADILKRRSENVWYITDSDILGKIDAALAAPPRNCDVGVPEERIQRWSKFCKARSKKLPPIHGFEWEDYPYEEGGDK